jgi:glucosamine--fructose-6-phosphate aminotransferase (isomerizing)
MSEKASRSAATGEIMFIARMFGAIKDLCRFFAACRLFIGKKPSSVSSPAIIFFPIIPFQLNCGFAGLMTFRAQQKSASLNADLELLQLWDKIKRSSLKNILVGNIVAKDYACGFDTLTSMEKATLELKQESAQEVLFFQTPRTKKIFDLEKEMKIFLAQEEKVLEDQAAKFTSADLETINSRIILLKDIQWTVGKDILANFAKIVDISGTDEASAINPAAFKKYRKINFLLNALDRLEVRGRDSAGLQIVFTLGKEKALENILSNLKEKDLYEDYLRRSQEGDLTNGSIWVAPGVLTGSKKGINITFTYKTFSIVGELGRNVRDLRQVIRKDRILQYFARLDTSCETAITHTRWASVGSITEVNCHPVNNYKLGQKNLDFPFYQNSSAHINVVLNGDIDNYTALCAGLSENEELIAPEVTTDTKIIPLQIEKYLKDGHDLADSFRLAVKDFEGSHAIAMTSDLEPGKVFLALKGSGQSIYVGISSDQYMFSSELYGLVEVMPNFIKMNGELNVDGENSVTGQIFILDQNSFGGLAGITACYYDGTEINLKESDIQKAEMTTRDIDRGAYPHFFLKEISESAVSIKRTLRGKYRILTGDKSLPQVIFNLGSDIVPHPVCRGLQNGAIKNIIVIGHGTAAVAGAVVADALELYLKGKSINIVAKVASELSGFLLKDNLSDTLVIPITQSGSTTDTNRAVTMAKERGAFIISIVNRRQSDITAKSHGVFYTSDGRDIEMSVASTKAFYSQIIAGQVLALFLAQVMKTQTDDYITRELHNLEMVPQLMARVLELRNQISASVNKTLTKKFWAVVGSGPNKAAADEIRIKLSELCYKTISSDIVENKKHIDLSAEPLILVCVSGNPEPVVEDIAKDVAIFKAHKAAVIVFAEEGDDRFNKIADAVIPIPSASIPLPVILNTMAGHLWGYYAACAIDKEALIFREFRNHLNLALAEQAKMNYSLYEKIADSHFRHLINDFYHTFNGHRNDGAFNLLSVKTISDLALLLKYAAGKLPLEDFRHEFKNEDSPLDLLDVTLGKAIDELTRPIDAIRHQAKTVTVGTSRKEKILKGIVFDLLEKLEFAAKNLTYKNILAISRIQPAVLSVRGYTLYNINNLDEEGNPTEGSTIIIREKGGVAKQMISRADNSKLLMGTKRTIVSTGNIYIGKGKADGASILVLPLLGESDFVGNLLLLHIEYNELLSLREKKKVLGYRYNDIRNLVDEYNVNWDDNYLEKIPLIDLFSEPVENLAGRIKQYAFIGD